MEEKWKAHKKANRITLKEGKLKAEEGAENSKSKQQYQKWKLNIQQKFKRWR